MTASQTPVDQTKDNIKACESRLATKSNPGRPAEMADFANLGIRTPRGDPVAPRCPGIWGNGVA